MSHWLVSNVPSWLLLIGLFVVTAGGAVLIQFFLRRRFPRLTGDAHNDVTRFAFGVVAFVYAFFIGFVVSAMWGQINAADGNVRTEGSVAVQMAKNLNAFDPNDSDRLRHSLLEYERAVLAEWPLAAKGHSYPEADRALERLFTAYTEVQPSSDVQKTLLANSLSHLDTISQSRTERVLQASTDVGPPWSLWAVILLTGGLVLGCAIIYGVQAPAMHYSMVVTVAALVAANLFLVLLLAHPFIGDIGTSPEPLRQAVRVLEADQG
ncbi:MAG: bestrophin-like domain [Mycobacterium sp.]